MTNTNMNTKIKTVEEQRKQLDTLGIMEKYFTISDEGGRGWQGCNYSYKPTAETAADIRKALKENFKGFKFSVRTPHHGAIDIEIKSGYIPEFYTVSSLEECPDNGDSRTWINGYACNYHCNFGLGRTTTEEEKAAYLEKCPNPFFYEVRQAVLAVVDSYNYDRSDSMTDYFDYHFIGTPTTRGYKYTPETEPKAKAETETATAGGSLDGVNYEVIDDIDTRNGEPLTVVKLVDRVSREEYKAIAETMKNYGGYYSKFKGGFIFKTRPAFLNAETTEEEKAVDILANVEEVAEPEELPQLEEETSEPTEENTVEYIDPSTLSDGDEITLTNIQQGQNRIAIFHCYTPSENSILVTMSNGLAWGVRKVYELGDRFQITAAKRQKAEPQPEEVATDEPQATAEATKAEIIAILTETETKLTETANHSDSETIKKAVEKIKMQTNNNIIKNFVLCPGCRQKTRLCTTSETVIKNLPLLCPKCKSEFIIDVMQNKITQYKKI